MARGRWVWIIELLVYFSCCSFETSLSQCRFTIIGVCVVLFLRAFYFNSIRCTLHRCTQRAMEPVVGWASEGPTQWLCLLCSIPSNTRTSKSCLSIREVGL